MVKIYINILGTWQEIDKDVQINNINAYTWITKDLKDSFVQVYFPISKKTFTIHTSNIIIEKISY